MTLTLIHWYNIFPKSEKNRLLSEYSNYKLDMNLFPDLMILYNNKINKIKFNNIISIGYKTIYSNTNYVILENKNINELLQN